ncbi:MAG: PilX N-terminal domain-containing pilus assembly protein [Stenotrophobium sp.]
MPAPNPRSQRGAISLVTALVFLIALSLITLVGSRIAIVESRIAANNARSNAAATAADAGLQAAQMYLAANRKLVTSSGVGGWLSSGATPQWTSCSASSSAPPCGNGSQNLYGASWQYYGPVPNLPTLPGEYQSQVWYLSKTLTSVAAYAPFIGCLQLSLTGSTFPLLNSVTSTLLGTVNGLLGLIPGLGGLAVPTNICLPVNLTQIPAAAPPSGVNPTIYAVAKASSSADTTGALAYAQVILQRTSVFSHLPLAGIMISNTAAANSATLMGDIRIWGNPTPPTQAPSNFSLLNLNNFLGQNLSQVLATTVGPVLTTPTSASLVTTLNLGGLANLPPASTIGQFNANVTFPLSIWSQNAVTMGAQATEPFPSIFSGARTCLPQWPGGYNPGCTPLSGAVSIPVGAITPGLIAVPASCAGGTLNASQTACATVGTFTATQCTGGTLNASQTACTAIGTYVTAQCTGGTLNSGGTACATVGTYVAAVPSSCNVLGIISLGLSQTACKALSFLATYTPAIPASCTGGTLNSGGTACTASGTYVAPQCTGGTLNSGGTACTAPGTYSTAQCVGGTLNSSGTACTAPGTFNPATTLVPPVPPFAVDALMLPDVQDPTNLLSTVTGLLSTSPAPVYPSDLLNYIFGYPELPAAPAPSSPTAASVATLQALGSVVTDCSSLDANSSGLYWVSGNCTLSGTIGSAGSSTANPTPVVIVTAGGNVTFAAGSTVNGVVYMYGGGTQTVTGASPSVCASTGSCATLLGALLVDGNLNMSNSLNVVYNLSNIRAAGFLAGSYAPLAGGWNDAWSAPPP